MATDSTIVDLVERIASGERSAESELVRRFYRPVFSMVLARTGDIQVAQDLTQEILMAVICALRDGNLRNHQGLPGFVCGTMRNQVRNHFRSLHPESVGAMRREPVLEEPDPEEELANAERLALAKGAIAQLGPEDRQILRLTLVEGLPPKAISERLGLSGDVVRQRKSRAIQRAREILRGELSQSESRRYSQAE
jgi:RNA polymerase sigma factor (sigma-70 family)